MEWILFEKELQECYRKDWVYHKKRKRNVDLNCTLKHVCHLLQKWLKCPHRFGKIISYPYECFMIMS